MKTFYMKTTMKFLKLLPALIFFMLAFSYNVRAQAVYQPPICYGEPIFLLCTFVTGGCAQANATYHWTNASGTWQSNLENPVIYPDSVGYNSDKFYLQVQYPEPPGSFSGGRVTVVVFNKITVTAVTTPVGCYGTTTGSITLTVTGGSPAYSYLWNDGVTTKNRTGLAAGTYTVTVTDQRGCQNTTYGWSGNIFYNNPGTSFTVGGPSGPLSVTGTSTNMNCASVCDGTITTTTTGGAGGYSYLWSNSATTANLTGLCAGTYYLTVTDANNCKAFYNATITAPPALNVTGVPVDVNCFGGSDGSIGITVTGGTLPYSFLWNNNQTDEDIANLTPGTYTVTVTDGNNCHTTGSWVVSQPSDIEIVGVPSGQKCFGVNDGGVQISVSGGIGPYTYLWSNLATSEDISNLFPGIYAVTVTDTHGCIKTGNWEVTAAIELTLTGEAFPTNCFGFSDGSINITPGGGAGSFTYLWTTGATTQNIDGLAAGTYTVTVTDGNGCKISDDWTVTQPDLLSVSGTPAPTSCFGYSDGAINTVTTGGTDAYLYNWSNGATTANISNLPAGIYYVTVTDDNGCLAYGNWTVTEPTAVAWSGTAHDASCFGYSDGHIDWVSTEGGTAPYNYMWSNGETTSGISNLVAGTYYITVTDDHGCTFIDSKPIGQPELLVADPNGVIVDASCFGFSDGSITIANATGGIGPYTYAWSNGATGQINNNLAEGWYTVTVTDSHNCFATEDYYVGQPTALGFSSSATTQTLCVGSCEGTISVTVTGGTLDYSYLWNNGQSTPFISGLCAGTYTLTVTDAHSCELVGSWDVTSPPLLSVSGVPTDALCNQSSDGSIVTTTTGGTGTYSYLWNTDATTKDLFNLLAGTYTVTVTDENNCTAVGSWTVSEPGEVSWKGRGYDATCFGYSNGYIEWISTEGGTPPYSYLWSNGETTPGISNLVAGTYTITVTDFHSCDVFTETTIGEPDLLVADPNGVIVDASCFGFSDGSITIANATGGTGPYTYAWSNGATGQINNNLVEGWYTVTVTDSHNCFATEDYYVGQPTALGFSSSATTQTLCVGSCEGTISVTVTGGTLDYSYLWNNGQSTPFISGLCAGTYTLTVTDNHNCILIGSWEVTSPPLLTVTGVAYGTSCNQTSDGSIITTTTGGTGTYNYLWNTDETTPNLTGLLAGTYTVTVTDANNCRAINSWTVTEPGEVSWKGRGYDVSCYGLSDGYIEWISTEGGTPPYSYLWNTGATTPGISNLVAGTYTITVTDSHSCDVFTETVITQPDLLAINPNGIYDIPTCYQTRCDGSITVLEPTGGTKPYSYLWSNGATALFNSGLCAGTYTLTVTDAHLCTDVQEFVLEDAPSWDFGIDGPVVACCNTSNINDVVSYKVTNLIGAYSDPLSYQWTVTGGDIISGQNTDSITVSWSCCGTGTVCLTVTQGPDDCFLTKCIEVTITPTPAPVITGPISVTAGDTAMYCVENGDPDHLYTWSFDGAATILSGQGTPCVTLIWGDYPPCGCGLVSVCEATQLPNGEPGCQGCAYMNITILPNTNGINLYGTVSYRNGFGTALDGVALNLRNLTTNTIVATTVTGPNMNPPFYTGESGYYAFMNVAAGNYRIEASFNGTWGGNNATDALLIQIEAGNANYLLNNYGLLNLKVANVNGSTLPLPNGVSALDALYVKLRTVGSITSYPAGDWKFDNPSVTVPVPGGAATNFEGLCYGDVNGSYIPTGLKEVSYLSVIEGVTETVPVEETFSYAIRSNTNAKLGAMTLFMGYDAERFEVVDIASSNEEMKYVIENGNVAIAWADTKPLSVKSGDELFVITVKAKAPITDATAIFDVKAKSEFADAVGTRYDNFELQMSKVITPNGSKEFTLFNYPNPFNASTKIIYTLPESGNVNLVITDMYGKTIRTLVDNSQAAGSYSVNVNATELNLSAGVYLYRIEVTGATENFVKVNKLIFAK